MEVDSTVPVVQNMLLLDSEGKRIAVKYFDQQWYALNSQEAAVWPVGPSLYTLACFQGPNCSAIQL